jgi:hypothetical protein
MLGSLMCQLLMLFFFSSSFLMSQSETFEESFTFVMFIILAFQTLLLTAPFSVAGNGWVSSFICIVSTSSGNGPVSCL